MATFTDDFTRANGALGSMPGGPAWEAISGSASISGNRVLFTTAPGSNPVYAVNTGKSDIDFAAAPAHRQGNALYARVVDANNWIRARLNYYRTSYQYYVTEYEHPTYSTEYEFAYTETLYQGRSQYTEAEYRYYTYGTWSSWSTYDTSVCRSVAPTPQSNNTDTTEYRAVVIANNCETGKEQYAYQSRTRTKTTNYCWTAVGSCNGGTATGNTRQVCGSSTSQYWATSPSGSCDYSTGSSRVVYCWSSSASSPCAPGANYTGGTRQVQSGSYWDTNSGGTVLSTRQAGPYTGYNYYNEVVLEKSVNGTVTVLGTQSVSTVTQLRMLLDGTSVSVFTNGGATPVLTVTVSDHLTATKFGFGGGTSDYSPSNPDWDTFSYTTLATHGSLRQSGAWQEIADVRARASAAWQMSERVDL